MASLQHYVESEWERALRDAQEGRARFLIINGTLPDKSVLNLDPLRTQAGEGRHVVFSLDVRWKAYGPILEWIKSLWQAIPAQKRAEWKLLRKPLPVVDTAVFDFLETGYPSEPEPFPLFPAEVDFYMGAFDNLLTDLWLFLLEGTGPHLFFFDNLQEAPESVLRFLSVWMAKSQLSGGVLMAGTWEKPLHSLNSGWWLDFQKTVERFSLLLPRQPRSGGIIQLYGEPTRPSAPADSYRDARFSYRFLALREARKIAEYGLGDRTGTTQGDSETGLHFLLGDILSAFQQNDAAILALNQALQGALQTGDLERIGLIYLRQSFIYLKKDDWEEAQLLFTKARKLLSLPDKKLKAQLDFHGQLLSMGRQPDVIVSDVRDMTQRLEKIKWLNLSSLLRVQPFYLLAIFELQGAATAIKECAKAKRYCLKTGHDYRLSTAEHAMGMIYQQSGDDSKALRHFKRSIVLREKLGNKLELIKVYNGTGYFSFTRGKYREALVLYEKSLRLLEEIHDFQEIALTLFNIGYVYLVAGKMTAAFEAFEGVIRIMDELRLPGMPFHERWEVYALAALSAFLTGHVEKGNDYQHLCMVSSPPPESALYQMSELVSKGSGGGEGPWRDLEKTLTQKNDVPMLNLWQHSQASIFPKEKPAAVPRLPRLVFHVESILDSARQEASLNKLHKKIHEIQFLNNLQTLIVRSETWQQMVRDAMKLMKNSFLATYLYLVMVNLKNQRELVFSHPEAGMTRIDFWRDFGTWADVRSDTLAHPQELPAEVGSLVALPLSEGEEIYGTLVLATSEKEPHLGADELKTLSIAVRQIAMAVELKRANEKLVRAATIDSLTGLLNRQEIYKMMANERKRVMRYKEKAYGPFSLLFIDLDNFKYYNDTFGHALGDKMLQLFSELLKKVLRDVDIAGRFGGDEFLAILPETDLDGAKRAAERLFAELEHQRFFQDEVNAFMRTRVTLAPENYLTCSIGVTEYSNQRDMEIEEVVALADNALYEAKRSGKNRVVVISGE